jgi:RNA 2',3'-cyclic 3'-phosphodiesterase
MGRVRTFLAIELAPPVKARVVALQESLALAVPDVKWVEPANLHLTLLFLGEVDDRDLLAVCRATQAAVADLPAFALSPEGVGAFPNARRPRIFWTGIGVGREEVKAVHDALEPPLLELGCYRREERQYTPHITLGRVKGERPSEEFAVVMQKKQSWKGGESPADEVLVMSSQLTPQGPVYTVLGRAPLG